MTGGFLSIIIWDDSSQVAHYIKASHDRVKGEEAFGEEAGVAAAAVPFLMTDFILFVALYLSMLN